MTQRPYELLARFKNDGTIGGILVRYLETVNGKDFELDPVPLSGVSDPAFADFANAFNAALVAERDQLAIDAASVPTLQARIDELEAILYPPGPDTSTVEGAKQWLANERYTMETGGIIVGGQSFTTQRDEMDHWFPRFFNAFMWLANDPSALADNPTGQYPYKPKNGDSVVLNAVQVVRAYKCISWYVNQCFAREAELSAMLNAGVPIQDVIGSISWPQTEFDW